MPMTGQRRREQMVNDLRRRGIRDERVLEAMARVPRHCFLDEALKYGAYDDTPLPVGYGQSISQPFTVARMTELLMAGSPSCVLEIGTGSGYQAQVLAELVDEVYSIERHALLHEKARVRLEQLDATRIYLRHGDGRHGWPDAAPFDAIMLTAVAPELPSGLIKQLKMGGVMIAPLGETDGEQWLTRIVRTPRTPSCKRLEPVRFVPLQTGVS